MDALALDKTGTLTKGQPHLTTVLGKRGTRTSCCPGRRGRGGLRPPLGGPGLVAPAAAGPRPA